MFRYTCTDIVITRNIIKLHTSITIWNTPVGNINLEVQRIMMCFFRIIWIFKYSDFVKRGHLLDFKEDNRTRQHKVTLVKKQCSFVLESRGPLYYRRTINEWHIGTY